MQVQTMILNIYSWVVNIGHPTACVLYNIMSPKTKNKFLTPLKKYGHELNCKPWTRRTLWTKLLPRSLFPTLPIYLVDDISMVVNLKCCFSSPRPLGGSVVSRLSVQTSRLEPTSGPDSDCCAGMTQHSCEIMWDSFRTVLKKRKAGLKFLSLLYLLQIS